MSQWLISLEGTEAGLTLSMALALAAAVLHAIFGALQKGRHDPWLSRAGIDLCMIGLAAPVALFLVPRPEPELWPFLLGALVIHIGYKILQAMTYTRGAYTVVYPVVRGSGPLFTVLGAGVLFGEHFNALQWAGLAILLAGIWGFAAYNLRKVTVDRDRLIPALGFAVATGAFVALYTTWDAWAIRSAADPFAFLAWFFLIDAFFMPLIAAPRLLALPRAELASLLRRGLIGAFVAVASFGGIMLATRLGPVGQAAVLRETSTVFSALIGWLMLGERSGPVRVALMAMIALGAVIVQWAA